MISMAIVGILGVIAFAGWENMKVQSMSTEAKNNLGDLRTMAEAYRFEYNLYATSIDNLGFTQPSGTRYSYSVVDADTSSCTLRAAGKAGTPVEGHVWDLEIVDEVAYQPVVQP